jgi:hypothetical protein
MIAAAKQSPHRNRKSKLKLFSDCDGLLTKDANWTSRMVLGDSLAEREALRGQLQCVYIDRRTINVDHITREPKQAKVSETVNARIRDIDSERRPDTACC